MANVFVVLPVPAGDGVGAWVDVSGQGPERTISVDGGAFDGTLYIEASNDAQASAAPVAAGPFVGPTTAPQTFTQGLNFLRVRRRGSSGVGTPSVTLAAPAAVTNVFGALNVPAGDGVGAAIDISGGGDINTFQVEGPYTGQILIETSTDGVNFSPTLLFTIFHAVGQTLQGVLSSARVRRRGSTGGALPFVSVGSQASSGGAGGGGTVNSVNAGTAISVTGPAANPVVNNIGVTSLVAGGGIGISGATGAVTVTNTGVTSAVAGAGVGVSAATGAVTFTNTGVLTIVAGAGISISGATGNVTVTATGGAFPGFGGAPPTIASASAAGAAGTASRSDHTHGLDIVTYTPSVAGMQVAGVIQQTFPNPTAVPAAFNVGADRLAYGAHAATGLLSTNAGLLFNDSNNRFAVLGAASSATAATIPVGQGFFQADANALVTVEANSSAAVGTSPTIRIIRTRGTFAAQTVVGALDIIGSIAILSHDGTSQKQPMQFNFTVDGTQPVSLGKIPVNGTWIVNPDTIGVGPVPVISVGWGMDIALGNRALATNAVQGFVYYRAAAGIPTGVPVVPKFVDNNVDTAVSGVATVMDSTDRRLFANPSATAGGWNYVPFSPQTATVASAGAGAFDSANTLWPGATFTVTGAVATGPSSFFHMQAPSVNQTGASTISVVATLKIDPPIKAGGGTWTTSAALYIDDPNATGNANAIVNGIVYTPTLVGASGLGAQPLLIAVVGGNTMNFASGVALDGSGGNIEGSLNSGIWSIGRTAAVAINTTGDVQLGAAALAAAATTGFAYMSLIAARPTGAPNAFAGAAAHALDLTTAAGHALWVRNAVGAQWEPIPTFISSTAPGAGLALINNAPGALVSLNAKWWTFKDAVGTTTYIPFFQ